MRCGMSRREVDARLLSGDWLVVQPDVFACAGTPLTHAAQAWAAVLAVRPPVALARRSAAAFLGLDRAPVPDEAPELVVPRPRRDDQLRAPARVRRMVPRVFGITSVRGMPVTTAALTLRELGPVLPRDWVRDMVQHALRRRRVTFSALAGQLGRGLPGAAALRDVLEEVAPGYQVVWEGVLHRALAAAGVHLEPQVQVQLPGGGSAFVDLGCRRRRFAVEVDGLVSHLDRFTQDRQRGRQLVLAGWVVVHVSVAELTGDLDRVVREIAAAYHARSTELGA